MLACHEGPCSLFKAMNAAYIHSYTTYIAPVHRAYIACNLMRESHQGN